MFRNRLKEVRKERGYTQKEMSKFLGISVTGYASWEQGLSEPDISNIVKIASLLDVTADYLFELEDEYGNKTEDTNYVLAAARSKGNKVPMHYEKLSKEEIDLFEGLLAKLNGKR